MKQTYIKPELRIVKVKFNHILAGSLGYNSNKNATSGTTVLSRRNEDWGDEEDW